MTKKSITRPAKLKIDQRSFIKARGETAEQVFRRVASEIRRFSFFGREDLVRKVAENPGLPQELTPIYGKKADFYGIRLQASDVQQIHYLQWILGIFTSHHNLLKKFLQIRTSVNIEILRGEAKKALDFLSELTDLSESWWGIETKIHITKELLGNDTKNLVSSLRERYPNLNLSTIINDLLLLSESSSVELYSGKVLGRIKEYKNANIEGSLLYGQIESMSMLPPYYDRDRTPTLEPLHSFFQWPIFDQYMMFRTIIMEQNNPKEFLGGLLSEILKLAATVDDWELQNALNTEEGTNPFVNSVIEKYTRGEYHEVVSDIEYMVKSGSVETFALIEVYARAKVYSGNEDQNNTFYEKLANELGKILTLDAKSTERLEYLHSIAVKFRKEAWAKSLLFHIVSVQQYRIEPEAVEVTRKQTLCLGKLNTPKARNQNFTLSSLLTTYTGPIPQHRLLRHSHSQANELVDKNIFPIYSDFLKTQCEYFLRQPSFWGATNFCIDEYFKSRAAFDHLPFHQICRNIDELARDGDFDHLAAMVVLDICDRESEESFDELRTDIFLEYLEAKNTHAPSIIFQERDLTSREVYFLRAICVPAQLDNIIQFDSSDEVIHERVAIIDILISAKAADIDILAVERDKVLETLFTEKLRAKIETGKLYVDVQALEAHRRQAYLALFERAKSIKGDFVWEPIGSIQTTLPEHDSYNLTDTGTNKESGEKVTILIAIFLTIAYDFALNQKYGLDKYLSAEIRHQIFVPQLRACFEKNNLVTSLHHGQYLANNFWANEYNYVSDEIVGKLDVILASFSRKLDSLLSQVNDKFKVWTTGPTDNPIFDFSANDERLRRVATIVNTSNNFDIFFNNLVDFMLELAVEGARAAQELINAKLMPDVLAYLDELEIEINELKGTVPMYNLMQAIRSARSDFTKEIEVVIIWFRLVGSENLQSFEALGTVIEAAVSSFRSIFEHRGKKLIYNSEKSELVLNYREARALFISLFIALENALRYGRSDVQVTINHQSNDASDRLTISNTTADRIEQQDEFLKMRREEWSNEFSPLSNQEGGTGLYKINNLLTNSSKGFSFDISIIDSTFSAIIFLENGYFSHRRQST